MLVCFAIATHHGAQGALWRAAGSDLRFTMTTAPKSTGAIAATIDSTRPDILPMSLEPRAKFAPSFKPTVKKLDAKIDEQFTYHDDGEKRIATLGIDSYIVDVKADDDGGSPMTMGSVKAMQGMLRASENFKRYFTELDATFLNGDARVHFHGSFAKMIDFDFRYFVDYLGVKWERRHALRVVGGYPYMATRGIIVTSVTLLATYFKLLLYPLGLTLYIYTYDKGADKKNKTKARAVYKINISYMLFILMMLKQIGGADAVTCTTCFDQCPGCAGGAACPFFTRTAANAAIVSGAALAAGAATTLSLANLLPLSFLRVLTRGTLDALRTVARRPPAGTPVDLSTMTEAQLIDAVQTGNTTYQDAIREISGRLPGATQVEVARLNAMQSTLTNMEKAGGNLGSVGELATNGSYLGAYTYAYAQAGRVARHGRTGDTASLDLLTLDNEEGSEVEKARSQSARIIRPKSATEFSDMLNSWIMICHATGLANVLITGAFLREIVYDGMSLQGLEWEVAHELFLVYLEALETSTDATLTMATVFRRGSQDTHLQRAMLRTQEHFKTRIFRGGLGGGGQKRGADGDQKWNGSFNTKSSSCCITYNLGRKDHPASVLNEAGSCRFNHICDHYVTDKGPKGQCGGKHPRIKCNNPNKCDKPV